MPTVSRIGHASNSSTIPDRPSAKDIRTTASRGTEMTSESDLIVNFTPTGMIPTKAMTPHVPVSVQEIVDDVHRAVEIGITMVHLHARDEKTGEPTYKAQVYERIIAGIRSFSKDLIICVSLSGRNFKAFEQRGEVLQLDGDVKPDMGSLTLSSLNFNKVASVNSPDIIKRLAQEMKTRPLKQLKSTYNSQLHQKRTM